jgi:hypothetical protein
MSDRMFVKEILAITGSTELRSSVLLALIRETCLTELYGDHPSTTQFLGENVD